MLLDVLEPQRHRMADQLAQHAAPPRQVADRSAFGFVDAEGEEPVELLATVVEDAERGIAGTGQLARDLEDPL